VTDRECVAFLQWALPRLGLSWPGFRRVRRQVCKRVSRRITALGLPNVAAYRAHLEADAAEWSVLDTYCWISVSHFWRDRGVWGALVAEILPELAHTASARGRHTLRAWSAGCASGEEPYSLRLGWDLAVAPRAPDTTLHVLATDASPALLERARRGLYPASALRDLPAEWRSRAFEPVDDSQRLRDAFRRDVELRQQDLRRAMPDGPFDLILCRNVAFTYFDRERQRATQRELARRLAPGGALLVGIHETLPDEAVLAPDGGVPGLYRAPIPARAA
jgi:chemotaxis protein methyltransferase CheR